MKAKTKITLLLITAIWLIGFWMTAIQLKLDEDFWAVVMFGPAVVTILVTSITKTKY